MTTTHATADTNLVNSALGRVQNFIKRLTTEDTSDVWALYRMTRGSDSVRPRVIRKLAADAAR
jgi:hypothetical protein